MKKLLGMTKGDKSSKAEEPPPPPPPPQRAAPPSSSSNRNMESDNVTSSSRNLEGSRSNLMYSGFPDSETMGASSRTIPKTTTADDFPPRDILESRLRDFYLEHEPKKADDLDKIVAAAYKNGIKWLQDGLARKYNGATVDFSLGGEQEPEPAPRATQYPSHVPPPVAVMPQQAPPARMPPSVPVATETAAVAQPRNAMFISSQPPPSFATPAGDMNAAVVYPNAAAALRSKGLVKYVKILEERGIVAYEDLARIEEDPADPLWQKMPPLPDKKQMRILIADVKAHVAMLAAAAGPTSPSNPTSVSTPFDDYEQESAMPAMGMPQEQQHVQPQGGFVLPPIPQREAPVVAENHDASDENDVDEAFARAEREEAEEQQRKKREAEEKRRMEEDAVARKRKETVAAAAVAKPVAAAKPPPPPADVAKPAAVAKPPPPPGAAMRRGSSSKDVVSKEVEEAEKALAALKVELEEQTNKCEAMMTECERLAKELDDAQAEAEREKERMDEMTVAFADAKQKLEKLKEEDQARRREAEAAAAAAAARKRAEEEAQRLREEEEEAQRLREEEEEAQRQREEEEAAAAAAAAAAVAAEASLTRRNSSGNNLARTNSSGNNLLPRTNSSGSNLTRTNSSGKNALSSSDEAAVPAAAVAVTTATDIAEEASHAKLKPSSAPREKTAEACDHFELDMKATNFGQCVCGHHKSEHKAPSSGHAPFQTSNSARFGNKSAAVAAAAPAPVAAAPTKEETPVNFAARGNMYPALEPCDNYQTDVSASAFGTCLCGHLKQHHKSAASSPESAVGGLRELPKLRSTRNVSDPAVEPVAAAKSESAPQAKPPPPTRRPSVLASTPSNRGLSSEPAKVEEPKPASEAAAIPAEPSTLKKASSSSEVDHRTRLVEFYTRYNPEKLAEVDTILEKFKGKESVMFKKLKEKYPDAVI